LRITDIQQAGRSAKLTTVAVEYTCARSGCCSGVIVLWLIVMLLWFSFPHLIVYWSRRYPQFPASRDRHPIPHPPSCHLSVFFCFTFLLMTIPISDVASMYSRTEVVMREHSLYPHHPGLVKD
jgi:hypothetical protein